MRCPLGIEGAEAPFRMSSFTRPISTRKKQKTGISPVFVFFGGNQSRKLENFFDQ